jgi:hypothetical protein
LVDASRDVARLPSALPRALLFFPLSATVPPLGSALRNHSSLALALAAAAAAARARARNRYARVNLALGAAPALDPRTVGKMGLKARPWGLTDPPCAPVVRCVVVTLTAAVRN